MLRATADLNVSLFVANHAPTNKMYESKCDNVGLKRRYWVNERLEDHLDQASIGYVSILKLTHAYARKQAEAGAEASSSVRRRVAQADALPRAVRQHQGGALALWAGPLGRDADFGVDVLTANSARPIRRRCGSRRRARSASSTRRPTRRCRRCAPSATGPWSCLGCGTSFRSLCSAGSCRPPRRRGSCRTFSGSTLTRRRRACCWTATTAEGERAQALCSYRIYELSTRCHFPGGRRRPGGRLQPQLRGGGLRRPRIPPTPRGRRGRSRRGRGRL